MTPDFSPTARRAPPAWLPLVFFVVLSVGGGLAIGAMTGPDAWYAQLRKPSFNPPNWLFAPVWTLLYVLIGIAGWRVWARRGPLGSGPIALWWAQLGANFLWSPWFFIAHRIDVALGVIVLLLLMILAFIAVTARHDRVAALLFVPYAAWVAFATVLNATFYSLNAAS
jgi:benzodiazapine receptor